MAFNAHNVKQRLMAGWSITLGYDEKARQYTARATKGDLLVEKANATLDEVVTFVCLDIAAGKFSSKAQ